METTLMIVTIIALALALGMSAVAWRLLRDGKHRTAARADALRQLAESDEPEYEDRFASIEEEPEPVLGSRVLGSQNSRTVEPRTLEPAADHAWDIGLPATSRPAPEIVFGATVAAPAAPKRRWLALAAVAVVMAGVVSVVYAVYRPVMAAETDQALVTDTAAPAPVVRRGGPRPIELLSLRHQAESDGTFTITGLVQNPIEGLAVKKVMAVVYLFDREGHYFATGKAALDFTMLQPGEESPFVIRVPGVTRVSRYRVGFRSEEGGIVAHVDRRGQLPGGTTGDAVDAPARAPSTRRSE